MSTINSGDSADRRTEGSLHRDCSVARVESEVCEECHGSGLVPVTIMDVTAAFECPDCGGTGHIETKKPLNEKADRSQPCPHCGKEINVGALIGSVSTPAKARSSRENGKLGGRPKKPKRIARRRNGALCDGDEPPQTLKPKQS